MSISFQHQISTQKWEVISQVYSCPFFFFPHTTFLAWWLVFGQFHTGHAALVYFWRLWDVRKADFYFLRHQIFPPFHGCIFFSVSLLWQSSIRACQVRFRTDFCNSAKNVTGILVGVALNLELTLGSIVFLTILILPIHENEMSFHILMSSLISFSNVLEFSGYNPLTFGLNLFQNILFLLMLMWIEILFLISFQIVHC